MNNTFAAKIARAMHGLKKRLRMALDGLGFSEMVELLAERTGNLKLPYNVNAYLHGTRASCNPCLRA